MQIKRLENEIGKILFERISKTVKLTAEGNTLINYARRIVKAHDDAVLALSKPGLKGFIRFGSRVDVFLPLNSKILVRPGQRVRGLDTPIAEIN